jgi:uncharacterized protein (DUF362 family)
MPPPESRVAIAKVDPSYPQSAPWLPDTAWPEMAALGVGMGPANPAYQGVRRTLELLGCDAKAAGTAHWNPLAAWIKPGDRVLLKPNWVLDQHDREAQLGAKDAFECLVTHTSVLRAVLDYVQLALRGEGAISVADAPLQACNFKRLQERARIADLVAAYDDLAARGVGTFRPLPIEIEDLRLEVAEPRGGVGGIAQTWRKTRSEPGERHVEVDLGGQSLLEPLSDDAARFRVTNYEAGGLQRTHGRGRHRYCIAKAVLAADVVIDIPKLKTHKKAGITVALKNLIGINGHKSYLPHHRLGSIADGGDEYLTRDPLKLATSLLHDVGNEPLRPAWQQQVAVLAASGLAAIGRLQREDATETGSWYGNDTIWRTCIDLNRILLYADASGQFHGDDPAAKPLRRIVHLVDGIVGGDGDGPLSPRPRPAGVVLAGSGAGFVDMAAALVMGLNWRNLPIAVGAFAPGSGAPLHRATADELDLASDVAAWCGRGDAVLNGLRDHLAFAAPTGWEGVADADHAGRDVHLPLADSTRPQGQVWRRWP